MNMPAAAMAAGENSMKKAKIDRFIASQNRMVLVPCRNRMVGVQSTRMIQTSPIVMISRRNLSLAIAGQAGIEQRPVLDQPSAPHDFIRSDVHVRAASRNQW